MVFKLLRGLIDALEGVTRLVFGAARRLVDMLERRTEREPETSSEVRGP
jgi:hypothetical protein